MEAKHRDLRTLAKEGCVNIDPKLVDELLDETVQKLLDEYAEKVAQQQQNAAVFTTVVTVAETFGVRGATRLTTDIANNPPILENITSGKNAVSSVINPLKYKRELLLVTIIGGSGLLAYDYLKISNDDEINDGDVNSCEKPKATSRRKTKRAKACDQSC